VHCLYSSGREFQRIGAAYLKGCLPYLVVDSIYEDLLVKAKIPSHHVRRTRAMALETFKILHDLAPPVLSDLINRQGHKYNFIYSNLLQIPHVKTTRHGQQSLRYSAPVLWNSLPDEYRQCTHFNHFKAKNVKQAQKIATNTSHYSLRLK
jgi:hypothetical protein